ncbi:hypothetical protein SNEBB_000364 [Seison nebaliae]|nr:hypothetical protein SNEBB_000364 [Seison nebaliae]
MDQMRRIVFSKENIEPNKNYLISIDLFERKKNGKLIVNNSPFFPFRQIETNSSEVINLRTKYVSYGSALLLWELPTEPNGIIKSFQIIINRLISNNQSIIEQKSIYPVNIKKITSNCPDKIMKRNQREFSVFISSLPNEKRFEVNIFPISLTNLFGKSNFVSFKTKPSNMIIRSHLTLSFKFDIYYQLNSTTRISEKKYEEFSDLMRYMNRSVEDFLNLSDRSVNEIINGYVMFDMKENSMKRKRSIEKYDDCELIEMNKDGNSLDISLTAQKIYNRKKYFILQLLHKISSFSFEWKTISLSDKSCVILPINSISTFYDARMILVNGSGTIFSSDNHSPSIHINGSSNNNTKFSIYLNEWMRKLDSRRLNLYNQQRRLHRLTLSQRIEQTIYQQWYIYMIAAIALIFILTILTFSCSKKQRKSKRARNQRSKRINSKESSLNSGSTTITMNTTNNMSNRQYRNTLLMNKNNNNNNNFNDIKTSNYIGDCESVDDDIEVLHRKHISTLDKSNAYSHIGTTRSIDGKLYTTEEENDAIAYVFNVPSNNPANILTLHTTKSTNSSTNSNENNPSSNGTGLSFLPLPNSSQLTNGHNNGYRTMNKNEHENGVYGRKLELINDYGQGASSLYQTTRTLERNGGMSSSDETDDGDNRLQHTLNRLNAKNYTTMQRSRMKMLTRPQSNTMGNNNKQMNQIQIDNDEGGEEDGENKEKLSFFHRFSRRSKRKKEKKKDSNNLQSHSQSTFCESKKDLVDECQMNSSINNDYSKRTSSLHRQQQQQQQQLQCQMNNLNEKNCHVMPQNQLLILNTKEPTTQLISTSINNSQMLMKNNNQKNNNQSIVVNTNGMNNDNCKYFQYLQTMVQNPASNQRDNFYAINMNTLQQQQQQQQKKNNNNQFQSNNFISSNQQQSNPNQNTLLLINRNGMMRKSFDNGLSSMNDKKQMNNSTSETHNTFGRQMNDTVPAFITNNPSNQFAKQTSNTIYDGMLSFSNTPLRKTMQNSHRPNHQTMKPTMPTTPQSQKSQNAYLTINSRILDDFNKTEFLNGSKKHNLPSNNLLRDFVHDDEETSTIHTGFSGYSDAGNSSVYKASSSIRKTDHLQYSTTGTCNNEKAYAPPPLMSNHQMQPVFSSNDSWKFVNNKKTNKNKSIGTLPPPHISLQPNKINEKNQINDKNQIDGMMDKKNKSFLPNLKSNDTPSTPPPPYSSTIDPSPISSSNTKDYLYSRYQQHYPLQTESNTDSAIML